ncbi:MAG: B12-binding domain-containing radical SAM protein [Chloroflexota bacterium]
MRILLVQPGFGRELGVGRLSLVEPLGLETVAGGLGGHDVRLLDLRIEGSLLSALKAFRPSLLGIHCSFTVDVYKTLEMAAAAKAAMGDGNLYVVVGGHHASLNPGDFAHPTVDAVVIGEGELTLAELVASLEAGKRPEQVAGLALNTPEGQVLSDPRPQVEDLDSLPFPARDLTRKHRNSYYFFHMRPMAVVETSRGCPFRCNFCSVWCFFKGTVRYRSPERVVEELARVREHRVMFSDDNFLADPERAERIAHLLRDRGVDHCYLFQARSDVVSTHPEVLKAWQAVGLEGVQLGLEKIDDAGLREVNKHNSVANNEAALEAIRRIGLGVMGSFIVDSDWDRGDFQALCDYLKSRQIGLPDFSVLTPLPGTVFYKRVRDQLVTDNYELFDLLHALLPTKLPLAEFYRQLTGLYGTGYSPGRVAIETFRTFRSGIWLSPAGIAHLRRMGPAALKIANPNSYLEGHRMAINHPSPMYPTANRKAS